MHTKVIDFQPLWSLLKDRHLPKCWLCKKDKDSYITTRTLAKLSKNQSVNTDTLLKVCTSLNVNISDICESYDVDETGKRISLTGLNDSLN